MRVLHVGMHGDVTGVAIAIRRLHRALLALGHDSTMFVGEMRHPDTDPRVKIASLTRSPWSRIKRRARRAMIASGHRGYQLTRARRTVGFHDDRSRFGREIVDALPDCDVMTVHAMLGWLDYRELFRRVPQRTPVVPILHDMAFFTGGCHYTQDCRRFLQQCGACPVLGSRREEDLSRQIWLRKRAAYGSAPPGRVHFVAPSQWVADEARRSGLLREFPISVIPNGVDTTEFAPLDRRMSRELLGLPHDAAIVLFVGEPVTRVTKGFALLAEAIGRVRRSNLLLVSAGSGIPPAEVPVPHVHLGYVTDVRLLPVIYSAADVFVIPSLQENCPQTVLEASACAIPVVGFATGGIVDLIRPGRNGTLVPTGDVAGLADALERILADEGRRQAIAQEARRLAVEEFAVGRQAERYAALFDALIHGTPAPALDRVQDTLAVSS